MTLTAANGKRINFNINFNKILILFGLCFNGISSLKTSISISNGEPNINNDNVYCLTQYPDEANEILNYGDVDSFCLKKGTECIRFTIEIIKSSNKTQDDMLLSYIAETDEITNIILLQNNTLSMTYLEESVCINNTCDYTVYIDKEIDWSLVVMNKASNDPPFEKDVYNPIEYKVILEDCTKKEEIEVIEERSIWILLTLCAISATCVILIALCCYFILSHRRRSLEEQRSKQIIDKNKKLPDLFSTSQSFVVQDYDIKVLPISYNIPNSPITAGIPSAWTFKFSNSDGSEDEPDLNSNDKNSNT